MRKGKDLVGLPVVSLSQAVLVGTIRDLLIDPGRGTITMLLLAEGNQQKPSKQVPFRTVRRIGPHAVMVEQEAAVTPISEQPSAQRLFSGPSHLQGLRVLTESGRTVGTVSDVVLDERSGTIERYEISAGHLRDAMSGRVSLSATVPLAVGPEFMIVAESAVMDRRAQLEAGPPLVVEVPPSEQIELGPVEIERVATELVAKQEDLVAGMRATRVVANEDAGGVICYEGEPITQDTVEKAKAAGKLNDLVQAAGEAAAAALSASLADQYARVAVGRMAGRTVQTPDGDVVVAQGDAVTREVVDRARHAGVLDQLMEAVRVPAEEASLHQRGREAAQPVWARVGGGFGSFVRRNR